jgi:hypothetical protein
MQNSANHQRRSPRIRSLIAARIIYNNDASTLDCVIRNISEDGAKLQLSGGAAIPIEFSLLIIKKEVTRQARITWRSGEEIGVEFLRPGSSQRIGNGEAGLLQRIRILEAENERLQARIRQLTGD